MGVSGILGQLPSGLKTVQARHDEYPSRTTFRLFLPCQGNAVAPFSAFEYFMAVLSSNISRIALQFCRRII